MQELGLQGKFVYPCAPPNAAALGVCQVHDKFLVAYRKVVSSGISVEEIVILIGIAVIASADPRLDFAVDGFVQRTELSLLAGSLGNQIPGLPCGSGAIAFVQQ